MIRRTPRRALTEADWQAVFRARCKSKQGQGLTPEERYGAMEPGIFDATVPFGSTSRWGRR